MKYLNQLVDVIRIDHFNGFAKYWEIPAKDNTGLRGKWQNSLGELLIKTLYDNNKNINLIAEDLGEAAKDAAIIMEKYNIPGMQVLQFSFDDDSTSPGGCPPPADEAGIAETSPGVRPEDLDEFGRNASQREWAKHYAPVIEVDEDGDVVPDGEWSSSAHDDGDIGNLGDFDCDLEDDDAAKAAREWL